MKPRVYAIPTALSRLGAGETSREPQNRRAIDWLQKQPGGSIVVVMPQKRFASDSLQRLVTQPGVVHLTWQGLSMGSLAQRRVLYAWPNRKHLNDLWGVEVDALVIIEWSEAETTEWVEVAQPVRLLAAGKGEPFHPEGKVEAREPQLSSVDKILQYVASMAAEYSSGLQWHEEDKLKADMMNRPERWAEVTVEQVRTACRRLGMRPNDVDTVAGFLQRRKEGRWFSIRSSYRAFRFN